jgi:glycosyltransferase involved in cell wall biosynthesis
MPANQTQTLSVLFPAYNEEAIIATTVLTAHAVVAPLVARHEIVVVDDGSTDGTGALLRELAASHPDLPLRIVTHPQNRGYGAALASAFDAAGGDLLFLADSDGQFDLADIAVLLDRLDADTDLVIGWRRDRADSPMRLLNAWGWKQLVHTMFGYTARDVDCAFKLLRREVWQAVDVRSRGATFSAELLVKARRLGFRAAEVPVQHLPRRSGRATGARLSVIARAFVEIVRLRLNLERELQGRPHRAATIAGVAR